VIFELVIFFGKNLIIKNEISQKITKFNKNGKNVSIVGVSLPQAPHSGNWKDLIGNPNFFESTGCSWTIIENSVATKVNICVSHNVSKATILLLFLNKKQNPKSTKITAKKYQSRDGNISKRTYIHRRNVVKNTNIIKKLTIKNE
jgi:hypothetical protein